MKLPVHRAGDALYRLGYMTVGHDATSYVFPLRSPIGVKYPPNSPTASAEDLLQLNVGEVFYMHPEHGEQRVKAFTASAQQERLLEYVAAYTPDDDSDPYAWCR